MNIRLSSQFIFYVLFLFCLPIQAEEVSISQVIQEYVNSANDCEALAYNVTSKTLDADEVFSDCVESRAILIGMHKRYGVGKYGEIDVFDKIEGYSYLTASKNGKVRDIALSYATAAGSEE